MKQKPMYIQIEEDIIEQIRCKQLKVDDQIMTEEQLCEKYGVSRMTINKALSHLAQDGYIYRVSGKGSFVKQPRIIKQLGQGKSFTEDMASSGLKAGSILVEYCIKKGRDVPEIAERLNLGDDDMLHYFVRVRTGDDLPIAVSYTYVSQKCIPAIDVGCLESSFYEYLRGQGYEIGHIMSEMTAVMPTEQQKQLLGIKDEALLRHSHTTHLADGRPMEYIYTYYVGSRYTYRFNGQQLLGDL